MPSNDSAPVSLAADSLHIHIADNLILDRENLILRQGERVGLVGRNGVGKSTLLKVLAGCEEFFTGDISRRRGLRAAYLPQEADLDLDRTVEENILDGARDLLELLARLDTLPHDSPEAAQIDAALHAADAWNLQQRLSLLTTCLSAPAGDRVCRTLSGGERRRVDLCKTLIGQPDLLMLDEPTNHVDTETIEWLEAYLATYPGTVLFVTHDRRFLDRVATRIIELAWGRLHSYNGNYTGYLQGKAERESSAEAQEQRRLSFIRREFEWIQRGPKARGTKSRSRIQRFEAAAGQQELQREQDAQIVIPPAARLGNIVVTIQDLTISLGGRVLIRDFSLDFEHGQRIGVVGRNGLGKTTLLRAILGDVQPDGGSVRVGDRTVFNYADQHRVVLDGRKTVFDEAGEGKDFVQLGNAQIGLWAYLKRFLFTDEAINTRVDQLSGGERSRLVLAKILKRGGNFLMLDEPTNDLDLATLRVLEESIVGFGGCVVVVSHDRYFLNRVCNGILAFEGDARVVYQPGDYDYYEQKRREANAAPASPRQAPARERKRAEPRARTLKWAEERELEGMEDAILAAEQEVARLEAVFSDPEFYVKHGPQARELTVELETARDHVTRLYERWDELEAIREG